MLRFKLSASLLLAASSLAMAETSALLELQAGTESLRFALPDQIYAADVSANFSQLQITQADGRNLSFAVCPIVETTEQFVVSPVTESPDTARVVSNADGSLSLQFSRGAHHPGTVQDWIVDLRQIEEAVNAFAGVPPIEELRSSPSLHQWSAPLEFQQSNDLISFEALQSPYFRIRLAQPRPSSSKPITVRSRLHSRAQQRSPHWYSPLADKARNVFHNPRQLPVIAARIRDDNSSAGWDLHSRQGDWDAWKPRARVAPGSAQQAVFFSAVTDPQWRIIGSRGTLQLAHPAHELRLPRAPTDQNILVHLRDDNDFGPNLSCRTTDKLPQAEPVQILELNSAQQAPGEYRNLRGAFLVLLLVGGLAFWILRRYRRASATR